MVEKCELVFLFYILLLLVYININRIQSACLGDICKSSEKKYFYEMNISRKG